MQYLCNGMLDLLWPWVGFVSLFSKYRLIFITVWLYVLVVLSLMHACFRRSKPRIRRKNEDSRGAKHIWVR